MPDLSKLRDNLRTVDAPQVLINITVRMEEIDSDDRAPTGDEYNDLWDALLDELYAYIIERRAAFQDYPER